MEIIRESALDKRWKFLKILDKNPGIQFMRSFMMNTSNNQMLIFQNIFY